MRRLINEVINCVSKAVSRLELKSHIKLVNIFYFSWRRKHSVGCTVRTV
jgi:hypothetical protein